VFEDVVEVEIRSIRASEGGASGPRVVLGLCQAGQRVALSLNVGPGDVHALLHELRGEPTVRSQAVALLDRVAAACSGRIVAARLLPVEPGQCRGAVVLETATGPVDIPTEPGQALAVAVCLGVPLLADTELLRPESRDGPLSNAVAAFIDDLDLSGLET
jgi:hypothetical protein